MLDSLSPTFLLLVFLALVNIDTNSELLPTYSNPVNKLVFFNVRTHLDKLFLSCNHSTSHVLHWQKDGIDVTEIPSLKGRHEINANSLVINCPTYSDDGNYTCLHPKSNESANIEVYASVHIKNSPTRINVLKGTNIEIHCEAFGTDPQITWTIGGSENLNQSRVQLEKDMNNVTNAILVIENATASDQNTYECSARNKATGFNANYTIAKKQINLTVSNDLVLEYSDPSRKLLFFDDRRKRPLKLRLDTTVFGYDLIWQKNGVNVDVIESLKGRYVITENWMVISSPQLSDDGNYTCIVPQLNVSANIEVIANVYLLKTSSILYVKEGDRVEVHCKSYGTDPQITWQLPNGNRNQLKFQRNSDNITDETLIIEHFTADDVGRYKCIVSNKATGFNYSINEIFRKDEDTTFITIGSGNTSQDHDHSQTSYSKLSAGFGNNAIFAIVTVLFTITLSNSLTKN
ncbi:hemicentin-1-like [Sitodiplosis mosellana]|uniref:hemicentin-1-like n=1 Tax=Sitodiplosis mosellana TaxID=263140 RepID=UPI0024444449|nr:hemicentin-1-like [Sitodiplosis mosellana]